METQPLTELHRRNIDKRPRKRLRLTWDVRPSIQHPIPPIAKVLPTIYCGQEFGNGAGLNYAYSSIYYKGIPHNGSPHRKPDDKGGHYVFSIGENLTPRYRILSKMGEAKLFSSLFYLFLNLRPFPFYVWTTGHLLGFVQI